MTEETPRNSLKWVKKYSKLMVIGTLISMAPKYIQLNLQGETLIKTAFIFLMSVIFYLVGYAMVYVVLRIQTVNPFASKKVVSYFCFFFVYIGLFILLASIAFDLVQGFSILPINTRSAISTSFTFLGVVHGARSILLKYT
jgi:hypothetical protein